MATLKDVVLGTPAGRKAMEEALKKSCEDQVRLLEKAKDIEKLTREEKNFIKAWAELLKIPFSAEVKKNGMNINIRTSYFMFPNRFKALDDGKKHTIEELLND